MVEEKVVSHGYIKLLALDVGHLETEIIMEKNTDNQNTIDEFKREYGTKDSVIIFIIYMDYNDDIKFGDYKKIHNNIHCFDYLRDLVLSKNGTVLERTDISNKQLWDTRRVKYIIE